MNRRYYGRIESLDLTVRLRMSRGIDGVPYPVPHAKLFECFRGKASPPVGHYTNRRAVLLYEFFEYTQYAIRLSVIYRTDYRKLREVIDHHEHILVPPRA